MRKKYRAKYKTSYTLTHIIIFVILLVSVVLGSIAAGNIPLAYFNPVSQNIYESFHGLGFAQVSGSRIFDSVFRYSRIIILVWVLSFLYIGILFQAIVIGLRGFFVGYAISIFVMQFGVGGLALAIPAILLHNAFLIIMCMWISLNERCRMRERAEKFTILVLSLAGTIIIGLYETYLSPSLSLLIFNALN